MQTSHLYCTACGAANQTQDVFCFACGCPLRITPSMQYPTLSSASTTQTGLLTVNHLLKQRYRILDKLGKGGFGAVYKAEDTQLGSRLVAVKEMSQSGLSSQQEIGEAAKAFEGEALMLADLRQQNLPRIYDHFSESGRWYLVMDFIEGQTLREHINKSSGGYLPVEDFLQIAIQLCTVLDYLHTHQPQIIFRDLKPDNIMLTRDGHVYLIDFGIARFFKVGQAKDTIAFGSPGYAAPEQYGKTQTTTRSDIYSLGVLLHQVLTGNDPATNIPTLFDFPVLKLPAQPTPARLSNLIIRMVEKDPSKRPQSIAEIKKELQQIAAEQATAQMNTLPSGKTPLPPTLFVGGTPLLPTQRFLERNRIFAIIAGIAGVILVVGFIIPTLSAHSGQSSYQTTLNSSSITSTPVSTTAPSPIPTLVPTATPTPSPIPTATPSPTPTPSTPVFNLSQSESKSKVTDYYDHKGEWAGQFIISNIESLTYPTTSGSVVIACVIYNFSPLPSNSGASAGTDQRTFEFDYVGTTWQVVSMGGHMSC